MITYYGIQNVVYNGKCAYIYFQMHVSEIIITSIRKYSCLFRMHSIYFSPNSVPNFVTLINITERNPQTSVSVSDDPLVIL